MSYFQKLDLKWSYFQENIISFIKNLRDDPDFSDVTLVSEDGQQIEAHKVLLSACSPFFNCLLRRNKHSHPMIYMRGLKSNNMKALIEFIYNGEANIHQEDLEVFLALGEELQLRGLTGFNNENITEGIPENILEIKPENIPDNVPEYGPENVLKNVPEKKTECVKENIKTKSSNIKKKIILEQEILPGFLFNGVTKSMNNFEGSVLENMPTRLCDTNKLVVSYEPNNKKLQSEPSVLENLTSRTTDKNKIVVSYDPNNEELEAKIESMISVTNDAKYKFKCIVCGKLCRHRCDVLRHVESHLAGVSHPCILCDKVSRSNNMLHAYMSLYHRQ